MEAVLRLGNLLVALIVVQLLPGCSVPQQPADNGSAQPNIAALIEAGHYRRASSILESNPLPADAAPYDAVQREYLQSRVALGLGQNDLALQLAAKASASEPKNAAYHVQVAAAAGRLAQHAGLLKQLTLAKRAKTELDAAVAIEPKRADALYGMMMYYQFAPSLIGGDKALAQKVADDLTGVDAARGYLAQASLIHESAQEKASLTAEGELLKKAVAANPDSYAAHIALARFLKRVDPVSTDAVEEQTCMALLVDPTRSEAWQLLAELAVAEECWQEVAGLIQTAERFNPDDDSAAYAAAVAMIELGKNLDTAHDLLTRYIEKVPEGEAPSSGRAHYELALLSEKRGQTQEAVFHLRAASTDDPTLEDARKELKRVERAKP